MPEQDKAAGLDFLDFLFTVIVSWGLAPEAVGQKGLLSEEWVKNGGAPSCQEAFDLVVFCLGFLTLLLSWYGYHASMKSKPLRYGTSTALLRFIIDVVLIITYGIMLLQFKRFYVVITLMTVSFMLFAVWDVLKIKEYRDQYSATAGTAIEKYRRELVSWFWALMTILLWLCFDKLSNSVTLAFAILITVLYRVHKQHRLLGVF